MARFEINKTRVSFWYIGYILYYIYNTYSNYNCFNIGGILAEEYKVLFIDSDPQCNLSYNCGIRISGTESYSVRDVFEMDPRPRPEKVIVKSPIKELPNLDIIPASIKLDGI